MNSRSFPLLSAAAVLLPAVLFFSTPPAVAADGPGWIALGPRADQPVDSVAVVPGEPSRVFVAGVTGVFASSTAAAAWDRASGENGLPAGATGELHASNVPNGPVYLLVGSTLYRGDEPGATTGPRWTVLWHDIFRVAVAHGIYDMEVDPLRHGS